MFFRGNRRAIPLAFCQNQIPIRIMKNTFIVVKGDSFSEAVVARICHKEEEGKVNITPMFAKGSSVPEAIGHLIVKYQDELPQLRIFFSSLSDLRPELSRSESLFWGKELLAVLCKEEHSHIGIYVNTMENWPAQV